MKGIGTGGAILLGIILTGCAHNPEKNATESPSSPNNFLGYQPIDPVPAKSVTFYHPGSGKKIEVPWGSLVYDSDCQKKQKTETKKKSYCDDLRVTDLLPLHSARVTVRKLDSSANVSYLTSSVNSEAGTYEVVMDFMKYRVDSVVDKSGFYSGDAIVGVGLRIRSSVQSSNTEVNFSSLVNLGVEAKRGNITGSIAVDVYGIDSPDVTNLIPLSTELDQTSIQQALQGLAAIKAVMGKDGTRFYPHVLGVRQDKPNQRATIQGKASVYSYTSSSEQLRQYWKEGGDGLKKWMEANDISVPIPIFLYDAKYEAKRLNAVRELIGK